jgi:hypothetical protein
MLIAPSHDAHDAASKALDEHHPIAQLYVIHLDPVICNLLLDPTLKAQHLHDWISLDSRWDVNCIAQPKMTDYRVASIADFWLSIPVSIP